MKRKNIFIWIMMFFLSINCLNINNVEADEKIEQIGSSTSLVLSTEFQLSIKEELIDEGIPVNDNFTVNVCTVEAEDGTETSALVVKSNEDDRYTQTVVLVTDYTNSGAGELLSAEDYIEAKQMEMNGATTLGTIGRNLGKVYISGSYEQTTYNNDGYYYYRPYKLSIIVSGSSMPSSVYAEYAIGGCPHTVSTYQWVDNLEYYSYAISMTKNNPTTGATYTKTAYSPYRYIFAMTPQIDYHKLAVQYGTADYEVSIKDSTPVYS